MARLRTFMAQKGHAFWRDEGATATVEFVIVFPIVMILFIAAFETAMILTRQVMLERALDISVRQLRITNGVTLSGAQIRDIICDNAMLLADCAATLEVDLREIDQLRYELPPEQTLCVNRDTMVRPANSYQPGTPNDLMLIRVCAVVDRILPFSGFGLNLTRDDSGGLHMIATSIFVVEPP